MYIKQKEKSKTISGGSQKRDMERIWRKDGKTVKVEEILLRILVNQKVIGGQETEEIHNYHEWTGRSNPYTETEKAPCCDKITAEMTKYIRGLLGEYPK